MVSNSYIRMPSLDRNGRGSQGIQSPAPSYRTANHFPTSTYDAGTSPTASSAQVRRVALPGYQLAGIELNSMSSSYTHEPSTPAQPSPRALERNDHCTNDPDSTFASAHRVAFFFSVCLNLVLFGVGVYMCPGSDEQKHYMRKMWSRPGSDQLLNYQEVVFATVPRKVLWSGLLMYMAVVVCIVEAVFKYGIMIRVAPRRVARWMVCARPVVVMAVTAVLGVVTWTWFLA